MAAVVVVIVTVPVNGADSGEGNGQQTTTAAIVVVTVAVAVFVAVAVSVFVGAVNVSVGGAKGPVAQPDRALPSGGRGLGFESPRVRAPFPCPKKKRKTRRPSTGGTTIMGGALLQISAVLFASFGFVAGGGFFSSLTSLRGELEGMSPAFIGLTGSGYYGGFFVGCLLGPWLIRRSGHIRGFATAAAVAGLSPLLLIAFVNPASWLVSRTLCGVAFAVLYLVAESWINDRAENAFRGRILSIYVIVAHIANFTGQGLLLLSPAGDDRMFYLVCAFFILALIPVAQTRAINPRPPQIVRVDPRKLWALSPVALVTSIVNGATNSVLWIIMPIVIARSIGPEWVGRLMPCFLLGGLLGQWPIGRISDFTDRRYMMLFSAALSVLGVTLLAFGAGRDVWWLVVGFLITGAGGMSCYALASAHANDRGTPEQAVEIAGALLLMYGLGAAFGPTVAAAGIEVFGLFSAFWYLGLCYVLWFLFTGWRILRRESAEGGEPAVFLGVQHGPALGSPDLRIVIEPPPPAKAPRPRLMVKAAAVLKTTTKTKTKTATPSSSSTETETATPPPSEKN